MSDEQSAESLAYELAGELCEEMTEYHFFDPQQKLADQLLAMVRAVVREELVKADERAQIAQKQAVQAHWDSDQFKAQVDALREGRSVVQSGHEHVPVATLDCDGHTVLRDGQIVSHCSICGAGTTQPAEETAAVRMDCSRCGTELSPGGSCPACRAFGTDSAENGATSPRCESVGQLGYRCLNRTGHVGMHRSEWTSWS